MKWNDSLAAAFVLTAALAAPSMARADACSDLLTGGAITDDSVQAVGGWIQHCLQFANPAPEALTSFGAILVHHDAGQSVLGVAGTQLFYHVQPYYANQAVWGILRSSYSTPDKLLVAERWFDWYLSHVTPGGIVPDYWYLKDGSGETTCVPNVGLDATQQRSSCAWSDADDSNGATFLIALKEYYDQDSSAATAFLGEPGTKQQLESIAAGILALRDPQLDPDATLTVNKLWGTAATSAATIGAPFGGAYTMDNSEVYAALAAIADLEFAVYGDIDTAYLFADAAEGIRNGIGEYLKTGTYYHSVRDPVFGAVGGQDWSVWYADTLAIAWPGVFGVVDPTSLTAATQLDHITSEWGAGSSDWRTSPIVSFWWPSIGYANFLSGDSAREADAALQMGHIKCDKFPPGSVSAFQYPFTAGDAGFVLATISSVDVTQHACGASSP